jgi:hypothetical protein
MIRYITLGFGCLLASGFGGYPIHAQVRQDSVEQSEAKIKVQSILVNEPVTVRDSKGEMVRKTFLSIVLPHV